MALKKKKQKRCLFFIKSFSPTKEEDAEAEKLAEEYNVMFRNASKLGATDRLEPADVVAGLAPARYNGVAAFVGKKPKGKGKEDTAGTGSDTPKEPKTKDEFKAALDAKGVEYGANDNLATLKELLNA